MSQVSSLRSQKLSKNLKTFKKSKNFPKIWKFFKNLKTFQSSENQQLPSTIVINNCHQCLKGRSVMSKKQKWLTQSLSQSVSDKVTYWAVRWQLKHRKNCECCPRHSLFKGPAWQGSIWWLNPVHQMLKF